MSFLFIDLAFYLLKLTAKSSNKDQLMKNSIKAIAWNSDLKFLVKENKCTKEWQRRKLKPKILSLQIILRTAKFTQEIFNGFLWETKKINSTKLSWFMETFCLQNWGKIKKYIWISMPKEEQVKDTQSGLLFLPLSIDWCLKLLFCQTLTIKSMLRHW